MVMAIAILCLLPSTHALKTVSLRNVASSVKNGFQQRVAADANFPMKSAAELVIAAGTQFTAEWNRRGASLVPEFDFVVAGVLTAMFGKYYAMWRVAPTKVDGKTRGLGRQGKQTTCLGVAVPTNAFQPTMLDGVTKPTAQQRVFALIAPMPSLFKAGMIASLLGYGLTAAMISLRSCMMPGYIAATRNINIFYASLFTGAFLAVVSNIRYQTLQGIVEPYFIDRLKKYRLVHSATLFAVRMGNGFLGSIISITGMKMLGLQKIK
jgi:hypothetical protein